MPARTTLRLGTRGSILALAQSRLVVRALRAADPGLDAELVVIGTRGDRDRKSPLAAVDDPEFFSAEIDAALHAGSVDFAVHSLKDLPLEPRPGIHTAAIPVREDPRDVALFRPGLPTLLRAGETLRIGSSSTRRAAFARHFLAEALPRFGPAAAPRLACTPLRGTVEQRLARLRLPRGDADALDGVVLALAGLSRLWQDRDGHAVLAPLLDGLRLMVLPPSACPTAPGQGALALECRSDDPVVTGRLAALDHAPSAAAVRTEMALSAALPAAERAGFGATCLAHARFGTLTFTGAARPDGVRHRLHWPAPPRPHPARAWDGADWARASRCRMLRKPDTASAPALFLAHWRALPAGSRIGDGARLWVSGVESWRRLARRGYWIEGCADNLGFATLAPTLAKPVLRLPAPGAWTVLTRSDAVAGWSGSGIGRVLATYAIDPPEDPAVLQSIQAQVAGATHFFWGSSAQYQALRAWLPYGAHHACGPGKTFDALRAAGLAGVQAFPSRAEWRQWLA